MLICCKYVSNNLIIIISNLEFFYNKKDSAYPGDFTRLGNMIKKSFAVI